MRNLHFLFCENLEGMWGSDREIWREVCIWMIKVTNTALYIFQKVGCGECELMQAVMTDLTLCVMMKWLSWPCWEWTTSVTSDVFCYEIGDNWISRQIPQGTVFVLSKFYRRVNLIFIYFVLLRWISLLNFTIVCFYIFLKITHLQI